VNEPKDAELEDSLVRQNLMDRPGYTPYCGADTCRVMWPRTRWDGAQFRCSCGWRSQFPADFIERYVAKHKPPKDPHPQPYPKSGTYP
jgi:hypothetical protein